MARFTEATLEDTFFDCLAFPDWQGHTQKTLPGI